MQRRTPCLTSRPWPRAIASVPLTQLPLARTFAHQTKPEEHRKIASRDGADGQSGFTQADRDILHMVYKDYRQRSRTEDTKMRHSESRRQESSTSRWSESAGVVLGLFLGATATGAALIEYTYPSFGRSRDDKAAGKVTTDSGIGETANRVTAGGDIGEWTSA